MASTIANGEFIGQELARIPNYMSHSFAVHFPGREMRLINAQTSKFRTQSEKNA